MLWNWSCACVLKIWDPWQLLDTIWRHLRLWWRGGLWTNCYPSWKYLFFYILCIYLVYFNLPHLLILLLFFDCTVLYTCYCDTEFSQPGINKVNLILSYLPYRRHASTFFNAMPLTNFQNILMNHWNSPVMWYYMTGKLIIQIIHIKTYKLNTMLAKDRPWQQNITYRSLMMFGTRAK